MTNVERFQKIMSFEKADRLAIIEWAHWWGHTLERWYSEGLPQDLVDAGKIRDHMGLDSYQQLWITCLTDKCPIPTHHGSGIMKTEKDYDVMLPNLYPKDFLERKQLTFDKSLLNQWSKQHDIFLKTLFPYLSPL
jgi:hypothetical protein